MLITFHRHRTYTAAELLPILGTMAEVTAFATYWNATITQ